MLISVPMIHCVFFCTLYVFSKYLPYKLILKETHVCKSSLPVAMVVAEARVVQSPWTALEKQGC